MQNTNLFYQKNALVTIMIARDIVNKEPGDKMVPIAEYERLRLFEMDDPDDDQDAVRPWLHDNRKMRSERNFFRKDQL